MGPQGCLDYFTYSQDRVPSVSAARLCGIPKLHLWGPGALDIVAGYSTQISKRKRCFEPKWKCWPSPLFILDTKTPKECNRIFEMNSNSINIPMKRSQEAQNCLVFMAYGSDVHMEGNPQAGGRRQSQTLDAHIRLEQPLNWKSEWWTG